MKQYEFHPLSELFPLMPTAETKALSESIRARGLQHAITLYEGKILDGRHRYEACLIAKVKPRFDLYRGSDPLGFVLSANLDRRHLDTSQRAMIAAKLENMPQGRPENKDANLHLKRESAAETLSVSPRSVATASKILDEAPALAKQVEAGKISLHEAGEKLAEKKAKEEPVFDDTGLPILPDLVALWRRGEEVRQMLSVLSKLRNELRHIQENEDMLWREVIFSGAIADLSRLYSNLERGKPYAVCPTCQGRGSARCLCCKGRGLVSKYLWDTSITKEEKLLRQKQVEKLATA